MYINQIDNLFDGIINKFNIFLISKKVFERFNEDANFVKYLNEIIELIKLFIQELNLKEIEELIGTKSHINYIIEIIKRYCAIYIYLGIAYYYKNDRDLFITNIIETGKSVKDTTFNINNFFNSENNSKIITMFSIIKDILKLNEYKTMERVKIILNNEPVKYMNTITLLNNIGEDYFEKYLMISDNFHNILKTLIFKKIYLIEEKTEIIKLLEETEIQEAEYKYIDIVESTQEKLIDFTFLQNILRADLSKAELFRSNLANEYYDFMDEYKKEQELRIFGNTKMIDFLLSNNILIPITEDFLRYHKNTEKYDKDISGDLKERDATKIKYIINKINRVANMNSEIYMKNQKLKLDAMNLFYKSIEYKDAVLYNDFEEIKIITKLSYSEHTTDLDYLIDLENMRSYAYLNYKDFTQDGFRFRPSKPVQCVRMTNIKHKNPKNRKLELRIGHNDIPINIIGLIFNPTGKLLECSNTSKLKDIRTVNKNGYDALYDLMEKNKKEDNLYYWIFDTKLDKVKLDSYKNVSSLETFRIIENMLGELFTHYMDITRNKIYVNIKEKYNNYYDILLNLKKLNSNYNLINIPLKFDYDLAGKLFNKIKNIPVKIIEPEEKKIIKIPVSQLIKKKDATIILGLVEDDINLEGITSQPICNHYIKWMHLGKISRKRDEELNQAIFDFVKQYVKTNEKNEYICKSCSEQLDLKKYVYEGTYVPELDVFLTTSLAVSTKLHEIPKYSKYTRTIRNIEKNIEKICYIMNLQYYIGNTPIIKLRRKMIIKDVIDLVLLHTDYLKKQPKDRIQQAVENYNIHKDLTNLFFFELKDDIFLTSSMDTDYYKLIKYNNIITYILLILISDINIGQIINLKDDKTCNFFIYTQISQVLFSKLYLRINEKEKIALINIPLLSYIIYYFACMITNNYIWLWKNNDKTQIYNVQKIIIHTIVDLINTLVEANMSKEKNFQYELIVNRIMQKIKNVYMDKNAYETLDKTIKQKIRFDKEKNTVSFITKKEKILDIKLDMIYNPIVYDKKACNSKKDKLNIISHSKFDYDVDVFTNCPDGKFHEWDFKKDTIICSLCQTKYNDLIKEKKDDENISRVNQLKLLYLRKLANIYCISGDLHDIDITTNKCSKCKINISNYEYKPEELFKLEKNLRKLNENKAIYQLDLIKKHFQKIEDKRNHDVKVLVVLNDRYNKYTENKLTNYIDDFIDILIKYIGSKIKLDNNYIYMKDTVYIVSNDYLGNALKNKAIILSSEDKIIRVSNHSYYKRNVLYFHDKLHGAFVYYDALTKSYLGYSKDNRKFERYHSTLSLEIIHSIRDMLINIGLENEYININHLFPQKLETEISSNEISSNKIIQQLIRTRVNNLRQIIYRTNSIIEKINNIYPNKENPYNNNEFKLIDEFQKSLKHFNTTDKDNKSPIFKHIYTVTNNTNIKTLPEKYDINIANNFISTFILSKLNNIDNLLIFYYIYNMNKLIEYNEQPAIRSNICYMLVKIINYCYNMYYIPIENSQIRKFDSLLLIDAPYIDESLRIVGYYQELVNVKEIDEDIMKEKEYDMNEEENALDIDEYDENDLYEDQDPSDEIIDNLRED